MHKHILLATNGRVSSEKSENHALQLTVSCGIPLTVVHILDDHLCHYGKVDTLAPLEARESFISYVIEEQEEASHEIIKKFKQKAKTFGASFDFRLAQGEPIDVIASIAKSNTGNDLNNIDLIIVGGHRSTQKRGFKGLSFADKLCSKIPKEIDILTII